MDGTRASTRSSATTAFEARRGWSNRSTPTTPAVSFHQHEGLRLCANDAAAHVRSRSRICDDPAVIRARSAARPRHKGEFCNSL
jgi:hypothetical protein